MRRLLLPIFCLLLLSLLLAPSAAAEEGDEGWSEEQGVPAEKAADAPEPTPAAPVDPTAVPPAPAAEAEPSVPGRPESYYQPRPQDGPPAADPKAAEPAIEAPKPFVMPTESMVVGVRKNHNAPWVGNWLAVELDMGFAVVGQAGKHVGATVTFYESGNERPLRAAMRPYVDAAGNLSVYTQLVPVKENSRLFRTKLKIPYRAFPWPTSGPAYGVEARVRLMSRDAAGQFEVLARSTTAFTIHYEKGCGCKPGNQLDCNRCREWQWDWGYSWCKIWGDEMGIVPGDVPCLPPPKGRGRRADWFEARWRTKGSSVDEFQRRLDTESNVPAATTPTPTPTPTGR